MPTITLTVGLPGCGKTTWAIEEVRKAKSKTININRDDIRASMAGTIDNYKYKSDNEDFITELQFKAADEAAKKNWNIIVSDTNLNQAYRTGWMLWAKNNGYDFKLKDFFAEFTAKEDRGVNVHKYFKIKEYVKQCHERNLKRLKSVEPEIIDNFADKYYYSTLHVDLYPCTDSQEYIIVDVDGTIAEKGSRNPYDESTVLQDEPITEVIHSVIAEAQFLGRKVIIMSGRHETCMTDTVQWLKNHNVPMDHIFMRSKDDNRPDDVVKYDLFMKHVNGKFNVVKVYDDRQQVCVMWRKLLNLKVFQVAEGRF